MSTSKHTFREPVVIHRIPVVRRIRGNRSHSAHYKDIKEGLYPPPVRIGPRAVGHPDNEVAAMTAACVQGTTDEEKRALVRKLVAARKAVA